MNKKLDYSNKPSLYGQNLANVVTDVHGWYLWPLLNVYSLIGNNISNVHFSEGVVFYTTQKTKKLCIEFSLKHGGQLVIKIYITREFVGLKQGSRVSD